MAEEIPKYRSSLTGPELDEALRNIGQVQDAVERTEAAAQTAEQYGQIVEQNQSAIQAIENNLDVIQQAPQAAQDAQKAAEQAGDQATAAARSAADAAESARKAAEAAESAQTVVVPYIIDVPTTGWTDGSLTWGDTTYTRTCTVTAEQATASPTSVSMSYEGGDYTAYCGIALIDTQDGSVSLWATADPVAECQIRIVEVRPGANAK